MMYFVLTLCVILNSTAQAGDEKYYIQFGANYNFLSDSNPNTGDYKGKGFLLEGGYRFYRINNFNFYGGVSYNYFELRYASDKLNILVYDISAKLAYDFKSFSVYSALGISKLHYNNNESRASLIGFGISYKISDTIKIGLKHHRYQMQKDIEEYGSIIRYWC